MFSEVLAERLAVVRDRFAARLDARIDEIASPMQPFDGDDRLDMLVRAHRRAHELCGTGPTLGFVGTGKAARAIEQVLRVAVKAQRLLNDEEMTHLGEGIALLRSTAHAEVHATAH